MKVEVAVADATQCRKDLTIEIPADEVRAEFEKTSRAYAQNVTVPGFRPGRAPLTIVKQRFSKDIKENVLGELVPHALKHAIVDNKLRVIGSPEISDISLTDGEPLRFKVSVEVLPDFELGPYKGLKLTRKIARVNEKDVDEVLEMWRQRAAELVPVEDRVSEDGDLVAVNLVGVFVEPPGGENLTADDVVIELGAEGVQSEFTENLRGVNVGDVREFRVVYEAGFSSPGLAGKTLDFTATVAGVRRKELPALDDEFAKELGDQETLAELRATVRVNLERTAAARADSAVRESAVGEMLKGYDFPLPESIVASQADELLRELAYMMIRNGVSPQSLRGMKWEDRRNEARLRAERDVRTALIIERIAEDEKITVDEGEIDDEIEVMAEEAGESAEAMAARLTKEERLSSIENRLRNRKTLEFIVNHAEVATEEIDQAEIDRVEADQVEADRVEADRVEADRVEADQVEADQVEADQVEADQEKVDQPAMAEAGDPEPQTEPQPEPSTEQS